MSEGEFSLESPFLLFLKELEGALAKDGLALSDEARVYLAGVMKTIEVDDPASPHHTEPLAPAFLRAQDMDDSRQRDLILIGIGNTALILCGWWGQYLDEFQSRHGGVDREYYQDVGQGAFGLIQRALFQELAENFLGIADVLDQIAHELQPEDNQTVVRLYGEWLKTHNKNLEGLLRRRGLILPTGREPVQ